MRVSHTQFRDLAWKFGRIQGLQVTHFYEADPAYGEGVAEGPGLDVSNLRGIQEAEPVAR
jgi:hypothetical protein